MAARDWIERQGELARALKSGQIAPLQWMAEVERLAGEIEVAQLMAEVDKAQITQNAQPPTNDPRKSSIRFLDAVGAPRKLGYGAALFAFEPHNVITPHGHRHMVSSHLVVEGAFRVRNFDRLSDDEGAMIVRPTRDYIAQTGQLSAMTPDRDNIHWFVPRGAAAMTFDVIISGIDPGEADYEIEAIAPLGGTELADGAIRALKIAFEAASDKYTAAL
jgi:mannose-6-phosphate isomerase-like protein (cupin superfamily)